MLEFLSEKRVYDEADMLKARIELLSKTNMVDYAIDVYKQLHSDEDSPEPQEMIERRREVVEKLHEFEQTIDPIVQLFEEPEVQEYIENRNSSQRCWILYMPVQSSSTSVATTLKHLSTSTSIECWLPLFTRMSPVQCGGSCPVPSSCRTGRQLRKTSTDCTRTSTKQYICIAKHVTILNRILCAVENVCFNLG